MKIKGRNIPLQPWPHPSKNRINKLHLAKRIVVNGVSQLFPVACSKTGEPKADWVVRQGKEEFRPDGSFYLEWWERSKRKRVSVGDDYRNAIDELLRKEVELQAIAEDLLEHPDRQLSQAVEGFLEEVKLTREDDTWSGYDVALRYFQESCKKLYVTEIERIDLLRFTSFLREEKSINLNLFGSEARTISFLDKEREVPVPTRLLDSLKDYRAWLSKEDKSGKRVKEDALIFSTASSEPQIHMLRALKRDAKRANLDPGKFGLHKFRATFATMHLQAGVDLRTVMEWMGQTNLSLLSCLALFVP